MAIFGNQIVEQNLKVQTKPKWLSKHHTYINIHTGIRPNNHCYCFGCSKKSTFRYKSNLNLKTGVDFQTWISGKMDVDLFSNTYAVYVMCGIWNDYWFNKNNFNFYFNSAG